MESYDFEKFINLLEIKPQNRSDEIKIIIASYLQESELIELLKKNQSDDLNFQNLLYSISEDLTVVKLQRDQILFRINDVGDNFYIILQGRVAVLKPIKTTKSLTYKAFYQQCLSFIENNEQYLLKLNLKANTDIFFSSFEEFEVYQRVLVKMQIRDFMYKEESTIDSILEKIRNDTDEVFKKSHNLTDSVLNELNILDKKSLMFKIRSFFELNQEENEIFTKYNPLINTVMEPILFNIYDYENFIELRTKQFFGDFALDSSNKKRTASIVACEETILGCISADIYCKHILAEKIKYRSKDIILLNNFTIFKHIKQLHFEKNYFQDFAPFQYEKDQTIFRQGEPIGKLLIIKSGAIDMYLNANLVDINLMIKNLILRCKDLNIFNKNQANELIEKFYDGLNVRNKSSSYFENLMKKKNFLLFTFTIAEAPGIESIFLEIPFLYKGVVKSDTCKIFKLDTEKFSNILKNYDACNQEYLYLIEKKVHVILNRLFNIKQCFVGRLSLEYDIQTKLDKFKMEKQGEIGEIPNENSDDYQNSKNDSIIYNEYDKYETNSPIKHLNKNNESYFTNYNNNFSRLFKESSSHFNKTKYAHKDSMETTKNDFFNSITSFPKSYLEKIKINFQELSNSKKNYKEHKIENILNKTKGDNLNNSQADKITFSKTNKEFFNVTVNSLMKKNKTISQNNEEENDTSIHKFNFQRTDTKMSKIKKLNKNIRAASRKMSFLQFPFFKNNLVSNADNNKQETGKVISVNLPNCKASVIRDSNQIHNEVDILSTPASEKKLNLDFKKENKNYVIDESNDSSDHLVSPSSNQKKKFCIAINNMDDNIKISHNPLLQSKDYLNNMIKFKVRNDVNNLINSKNEKQTLRNLMAFSMSNMSLKNYNRSLDKNFKDLSNVTTYEREMFFNKHSFDIPKNFVSPPVVKQPNNNKRSNYLLKHQISQSEKKPKIFGNRQKESLLADDNSNNNKTPLLGENKDLDILEKKRRLSYFYSTQTSFIKNIDTKQTKNRSKEKFSLEKDERNDKTDNIINESNNNYKIINNLKNKYSNINNNNLPIKIELSTPIRDSLQKNNLFNRNDKLISFSNFKEKFNQISFAKNNSHHKRYKDKFLKDSNTPDPYSVSNGFSCSEKNYRTTLESYLPIKASNIGI